MRPPWTGEVVSKRGLKSDAFKKGMTPEGLPTLV
jgi:hypothetical protein